MTTCLVLVFLLYSCVCILLLVYPGTSPLHTSSAQLHPNSCVGARHLDTKQLSIINIYRLHDTPFGANGDHRTWSIKVTSFEHSADCMHTALSLDHTSKCINRAVTCHAWPHNTPKQP